MVRKRSIEKRNKLLEDKDNKKDRKNKDLETITNMKIVAKEVSYVVEKEQKSKRKIEVDVEKVYLLFFLSY